MFVVGRRYPSITFNFMVEVNLPSIMS